jgi:hypothetical protein
MPSHERLLRLYPRDWRERYGEEFLAIVGQDSLSLQQFIDIVSGAIDAWLSADVRQAARAGREPSRGEKTMLKSIMSCRQNELRFTRRDSLIGAGVLIGATLLFSLLGIAARRQGWPVTSEVLLTLAFPGSVLLSMPFTFLKGQSWKAQAVILLTMFALLFGASYLASLT